MIVFSDGADTASRYGGDDVEDLARRSNIPIYLIVARSNNIGPRMSMAPLPQRRPGIDPGGFFPPGTPQQRGAAAGQHVTNLGRVIRATGGLMHRLDELKDLPAVYEKIDAALRAQTLVVIRTDPGRSESDWRRIDVEVAGRNRDVRAPEGYYAPW